MYEMERLYEQGQRIKDMYPEGTRIYLNHMEDPFSPVPPGTRGTVKTVDSIGQIHMSWDNGRSLALVPGVDDFRKLTAKELEEEHFTSENKPSLDDTMTRAITRMKQQPRKSMDDLDKNISFRNPER